MAEQIVSLYMFSAWPIKFRCACGYSDEIHISKAALWQGITVKLSSGQWDT